ncbi:MAG TPA: hypothetical protein VJ583_04175 [Nitrososphaeraceae archaeon]|nr:hypothetical protein [Nitrososphaeraceae archaeon]
MEASRPELKTHYFPSMGNFVYPKLIQVRPQSRLMTGNSQGT